MGDREEKFGEFMEDIVDKTNNEGFGSDFDDDIFNETNVDGVFDEEKRVQDRHMGGPSGDSASPYAREPDSDSVPRGKERPSREGQDRSGDKDTSENSRFDDYGDAPKQSKVADLLGAGLIAVGLTKAAGKVSNSSVGNTIKEKFGFGGEEQEQGQQEGREGRGGIGGRANRGAPPPQQQQQPEKMTWGQRLAMIIVAMVGLFAVMSFGTFMINTIMHRDSNPTVDGFQEVVQNIHKGGTIEGINNPNKKIWTTEERKVMPYIFEDDHYIQVKNEGGSFDNYYYTELKGFDKSEIASSGYVWVKYILDGDTNDIIDVRLDGLVNVDDPYQDVNIVKGEDGEIIEIKKDKLTDDITEPKILTQSEYEEMSQTDQELYNLKVAEESTDKQKAEENEKITTKIKNGAIETKDKVLGTIYGWMGKEYGTEESKKLLRRQFSINPIKEDGTKKTKEEISEEIEEIKENIGQ